MADLRGVEIQIAGPLPHVTIDVARLELILVNLISNAIKYSDPDKGDRFVRVEACLTVRPRQPPSSFRTMGSDSGGDSPTIFQRFVRAHVGRDTRARCSRVRPGPVDRGGMCGRGRRLDPRRVDRRRRHHLLREPCRLTCRAPPGSDAVVAFSRAACRQRDVFGSTARGPATVDSRVAAARGEPRPPSRRRREALAGSVGTPRQRIPDRRHLRADAGSDAVRPAATRGPAAPARPARHDRGPVRTHGPRTRSRRSTSRWSIRRTRRPSRATSARACRRSRRVRPTRLTIAPPPSSCSSASTSPSRSSRWSAARCSCSR